MSASRKFDTSVVRWKPIAHALAFGTMLVRLKDGQCRVVSHEESGFYDHALEVLFQENDLVSFCMLSDLDNRARSLSPEDYDACECPVCSAQTNPKSVSAREATQASVAYSCAFCGSSWRVNDSGDQTHFRRGNKRL